MKSIKYKGVREDKKGRKPFHRGTNEMRVRMRKGWEGF